MPTIGLARGPASILSGHWKAVALCLGLSGAPMLAAGQSLDLDSGTNKPLPAPAAPSTGGLDMDVKLDAPIPPKPADNASEVKAGIAAVGSKITPEPAPSDLTGSGSGTAAPPSTESTEAPPPRPEPITLAHAKVIDTAKLQSGDTTVSLFGIEGLGGDSAQGLQAYLGQSDKPLNCQAKDGTAFVCLMGDGTDVALVALVNGAARTKAEAPDVYREQEIDAQKNRRGIWSKLPPRWHWRWPFRCSLRTSLP